MIQIDFSPIFQYLDTKFKEGLIVDLREVFVTKEGFRLLQSSIDANTKELVNIRTEIATLGHRTIRIEDWVIKAAPKVGIDYEIKQLGYEEPPSDQR